MIRVHISNDKTDETHDITIEDLTGARHWIINHLDTSIEWNVTQVGVLPISDDLIVEIYSKEYKKYLAINLDEDAIAYDDLECIVQSVIQQSIATSDSYFKGMKLEDLCEMYEEYNSLDEYNKDKVIYLLNEGSNIIDIKDALDAYENVTIYHDTTIADMAREECVELLDGDNFNWLLIYIDYDHIVRDRYVDYIQDGNNVFRMT